jgi:hypothetical protein
MDEVDRHRLLVGAFFVRLRERGAAGDGDMMLPPARGGHWISSFSAMTSIRRSFSSSVAFISA